MYETPFGKVGVVICFDRHFPESIRTCAFKGAELIIILTANVKAEPMELFEWEIRVQAYQNNVFIAMCNRTGLEGDMDFVGESILVDCEGKVLQKANSDYPIWHIGYMLAITKQDSIARTEQKGGFDNCLKEKIQR